MERDFMGLNSKKSVVVVKEEAVEICQDTGFRWSLSSKLSTLPHFMSLKYAQDEKPLNFVSDRNAPSGFGGISAVDAFDAAHRRQSAEIQNVHATHLPNDVKMLPFSMSNLSYKVHFGSAGQNFAASPMKEHFLGGIPVTVPLPIIPSSGSVAGTTEHLFNSKGSAPPAQLTIFCGGTVNVFDDISPEKAQAIMCLAGNGCTPPNVVQPRFQVLASASKLAAVEGTFVNKTPDSIPASAHSSPISISSHPIGQSGGSSADKDEGKTSKSAMISLPAVSKLELLKIVGSLGSVGATTIMPAAVPQARKASLARFLEKRKERVMSSTPYIKKPVECINPESNDVSFSATSNVSTSPLLVGKET